MGQFHWDPDTYLAMMFEEVPDYARLQDETAAASGVVTATAILELGTGTGESARRLLAAHPGAHLTGVDESPEMLAAARAALDPARVTLRQRRLEDPLPAGPFELVASRASTTSRGRARPTCSPASPPSSPPEGCSCSETSSSLPIPPTPSRRSTTTTTLRAPSTNNSAGSRRRDSSHRFTGPAATSRC